MLESVAYRHSINRSIDYREVQTPLPSPIGYLGHWLARPGSALPCHVHADGLVEAQLVRLTRGGPRPESGGAELSYEEVATASDGSYEARPQELRPGSYMRVPGDLELATGSESLRLQLWVYPTLPAAPMPQGLIAQWDERERAGWALRLDADGGAELIWHDADGKLRRASAGAPMLGRHWHLVVATIDHGAGQVNVVQRLLRHLSPDPATASGSAPLAPGARLEAGVEILVGAQALTAVAGGDRPHLLGGFNGKLGNPRIDRDPERGEQLASLLASGDAREGEGALAAWDFSRDPGTRRVTDVSGGEHHGVLVNAPLRAVTAANWTGEWTDFRGAPEQYAAIHFHDDDLEDAGWEETFQVVVPDWAPSGLYAVRLRAEGREDFIPFAVPPAAGATAPVLVVLPTWTYQAYSNMAFDEDNAEKFTGGQASSDPVDAVIRDRRDIGWSLYNEHTDGSGIAYVSRLRPMLDMRPTHEFWLSAGGGWAVSGDMYLIDWLEALGIPYDVTVDDLVDGEGVAALAGHRTVITGAHPEYCSGAMLDAYASYLDGGGNMMYLGGNGFYWVTTVLPDRPHLLEIRRGHAGTRTWENEPGEDHHSSTGEPGNLWRYRGRAPQSLVGVGFAAQGGGGSAGYVVTAPADPRTDFILEGVDRERVLGEYGSNQGGAAGDEIDRMDAGLGTPPHAVMIATSSGRHSDWYQQTVEELTLTFPGQGGTENPEVRADVAYFETPNGGAVFTSGSIDWSASLAHRSYANDVSRITANVLSRFAGIAIDLPDPPQ